MQWQLITGLNSKFIVTDGQQDISVQYGNALPSLFREGQGVVAEGRIIDGIFMADNVLAKHDENYMPADVAEKLKEQGVWQGTETKTGDTEWLRKLAIYFWLSPLRYRFCKSSCRHMASSVTNP